MAAIRPLLLASCATASLLFFGSGCAKPSATDAELAVMTCEPTLQSWIERDSWPTETVLLGDQEYGRSELHNLQNSRGNRVANVAIQLAVAQLNIEAGAVPSTEVIDAIFETDAWLLDAHEPRTDRRLATEAMDLLRLESTLHDFNEWAGTEASCSGLGGVLTAMN